MGHVLSAKVTGSAFSKAIGPLALLGGALMLYRGLNERNTGQNQPWGGGYAGMNEWIHRQSIGTRSKIVHHGKKYGHMGHGMRWPFPPQPSVNQGNRVASVSGAHA